jgi:excinuclease UvrABC helicase subunit UvrB
MEPGRLRPGAVPMAAFELIADFRPTGDQPEAIAALVAGFRAGGATARWRG